LNALAIPPTVCLNCGGIVPEVPVRKTHIVKGLNGETVKKLLNQGLKKSEIARRLGVAPSAISYWCKKIEESSRVRK